MEAELTREQVEVQIASLQRQLEDVMTRYELVGKGVLPEEEEYIAKVEDVKSKRHQSLVAYKESEMKAAQKLYEGMIYAIENDHESSIEMVNEKVEKFIQFKFDELCDTLPEAAKYFASHKATNEFLKKFGSKLPETYGGYTIERSSEPLLSPSEIDATYGEIRETNDLCSVITAPESGECILMYNGGKYTSGTNINLKCEDSDAKQATMRSVTPKGIEVTMGEKTVKIPLTAINVGVVVLSKN